jgi:membrane-associated phospholipid phosphatase
MLFSTILPLTDLIWRRRTGRISDWHISRREERRWPLIFGVLYATLGFFTFYFLAAPRMLQACMLCGVSLGLITLTATWFWKISLHMMGNTSLAVILFFTFNVSFFSLFTFILLLFLICVGLSRLVLKAHTPAQILAGAVAGAGVTWAIFALMGVAA